MNVDGQPLYHVTTLSNFARAYDKYTRQYRKSCIPESTYPQESYLLPGGELAVGIAKASRLRDKLKIPGDSLLVLKAAVGSSSVQPNLRNGVGVILASPDLPISGVFQVRADGTLGPSLRLEDAMARSLALHAGTFAPYAALQPRAVSFLPIARGCQAACPFCFSEASVSVDQSRGALNLDEVDQWADLARSRGAERAVITGGGEPTLLPWQQVNALVSACKRHFNKVVLITNGVRLASLPEQESSELLRDLAVAGLTVLAVSRHHYREDTNAKIMKFETWTPAVLKAAAAVREILPQLRLRLICVLQKGGVESATDVSEYVSWATGLGVQEICFKELYVATSEESVYYAREANVFSTSHQVPLTVVPDWAHKSRFRLSGRLPWGAPIFDGNVAGRPMRVAAYAEPSLYWERSHGLARSWNVMSDGTCLASLEDRKSQITRPSAEEVH
jgi:pyruvate-formate lyase-activating enzyme